MISKNLSLLQQRALQLRIDSIRATTASGSGHPTTCLSSADIVSALFFDVMQFDVHDPKKESNDRLIVSKGHGIPVVYAAYKQLGVLSDEELMSLRDFDSELEGHPTPRFAYNEAATGSLGQGLAIGAGMAISAVKDKLDFKTYVLLGDGELAEGSVWEAAEFAAKYKLHNLVGIVDCNRLAQSGESLHGHDVETYAKKFKAFGWHTIVVDGHDMSALVDVFADVRKITDKPIMIVAKTIKGYGLEDIEDKNGFHGKPIKREELDEVLQKLKDRFGDVDFTNPSFETLSFANATDNPQDHVVTDNVTAKITINIASDANKSLFEKDEKMATRKAYGYALASLGKANNLIMALDADVKNSTHSDIFEKEFPDRFIQCFIAEQTMVGVATGLQVRGKIPFAATFGAFFSRAYDQIRMAGIGRNALRLCGSHSGVSIGQDGPSQMALEDIAMIRAVPNSIFLYPSDAISAYKLVEVMANYNDGISYLRTTRAATPMLYDHNESFEIGGCKVLRESENDVVCIVAAGITLHEALKAHDQLKEKGIFVSVIDAYSVKPLDEETIRRVAKKSGNKVITVEDHYIQGGLGEVVASALVNDAISVEILAVKTVSRSGKPEELMRYAGIDAQAIVEKVKGILH